MRLGYNTNGLAHHALPDAIRLLSDIGFQSVAITLDHQCLNPFAENLADEIAVTKQLLAECKMHSVIETGARFLLDPSRKHQPTLFAKSPADRARRVDFLCRTVDIAAELGSDCVSIWSGAAEDETEEYHWQALRDGIASVLNHARRRGVVIGFEPEPDMFIDTMHQFERLTGQIDTPGLKLTLDVGHLHCLGETPIADVICDWQAEIVNVHIEDMVQGTHEHLMFGDGEIDFPPIIAALRQVGYAGGVHVELSRHSHAGVDAARDAFDFLSPLVHRL